MKKLLMIVLLVLLVCICVHGTISADFDGPYFNSIEFESWDKALPPWDSSNWIVVDGKSRPYKLEDKIIFITSLDFSVVSGYCDKVRVLFYSRGDLRDKKNILKIGNGKDSIPQPQFAIVALPSKWTDYVSICAYQIKNRESILFDTWIVPLKEFGVIIPRRIFEKALSNMCELKASPEHDLPVHWLHLKVVDKNFYITIGF
jgi:hypothetical protein